MRCSIFELSDTGRSVTWADWLKMGGFPGANAGREALIARFGPMSSWEKSGLTLGQIADARADWGRSIARYAYSELDKCSLAIPYVTHM